VPAPPSARSLSSADRARPILNADDSGQQVNRMIFYPLVIGLFLLVDTVLRQTGH
jgi:hypothetical protein